ncbi:MAG: N-glycosylase [Candidatus Methanomethylicota archaeon]|uniref:8-oxoguanine DNA glycosylase/AP lyase n=1 Tax=Thermoproteota archaeon TaxID=2056631 RepID=A0A497F4G2_9CREN|nr:MAG: N-glycosylase [Candidatus Verstraetearchaeota archaeon]
MGLAELIEDVVKVKSNSRVRKLVEKRVEEFIKMKEADENKWFEELVFCILTANSSAKIGLKAIEKLKKEKALLEGPIEKVEEVLRKVGHRYAKKRAEYIILARKLIPGLKRRIISIKGINNKRMWLVQNVMGIGMKEASHFLRNVGYFDVAIIDRHILKILSGYDIIDKTFNKRTLTIKRYLKIENILKKIAKSVDLKPGILDLYLWYMSTGKVLK